MLRLSSAAFKRAIDDHPQALIQLIRVVARRLQRITFLVMYRCVRRVPLSVAVQACAGTWDWRRSWCSSRRRRRQSR